MSRVEIELKHNRCPGCCMWSGIQDVYCTETGYEVPEAFLFMMASFAETVYVKLPQQENARFFSVGDGTTQHTYGNMKDILGLDYDICVGESYEKALKSVYQEIDDGHPVVIGPLDMYYLPYLKMYHFVHIPIHYILMVGYDTEKDCALIYDCDRQDLIELPMEEFAKAWDSQYISENNRNGYVKFRLSKEQKTPEQILIASMKRKAYSQLATQPEMIGITSFAMIAREFPNWRNELSEKSYRTTLMHLPEFWGFVPKLPDRFFGNKNAGQDIPYQGNMDRLANCLITIGEEKGNNTYQNAGRLFAKSGELYQDITDHLIEYICDGVNHLNVIPDLFLQIGILYEEAYKMFL